MRLIRWSGVMFLAALALGGCSNDPPCAAGQLPAEWQAAPLSGLVPDGVHVCAGATATRVQYWNDEGVHRTNMDGVDRVQSAGWNRTSDNWYSGNTDFEAPQWSEFSAPGGTLRLDVHESNGGAIAELVFTPGG